MKIEIILFFNSPDISKGGYRHPFKYNSPGARWYFWKICPIFLHTVCKYCQELTINLAVFIGLIESYGRFGNNLFTDERWSRQYHNKAFVILIRNEKWSKNGISTVKKMNDLAKYVRKHKTVRRPYRIIINHF